MICIPDGEHSKTNLSIIHIEQNVTASRTKTFDIFSNYENYSQILPSVFTSVRIRSVRNNTAVSEEHIEFGNSELVVMAKHVLNPPVLHEVFFIGGSAKGTSIKQQFLELDNGTKVIIDIDYKPDKTKLLSSLIGKSKNDDNFQKIFNAFFDCCK
jgi:ribosome-associated toxin RatA of RatAB toxin-antitoxin module